VGGWMSGCEMKRQEEGGREGKREAVFHFA
jgi:hypothetical protein